MKMTIDQKSAEERMRAGVLTSQGFLGSDSRRLADIIEADEEEFRALGLDFDAVADRLEHLAREGEKGLGEPLTVDGEWLVKSDESRGKIPCPYQDGIFHKNAVTVEHVHTGERLVYSDLSVHLLRTHHFCQGQGIPFRLEPAALKRLMPR
jgi:hypothetical protein